MRLGVLDVGSNTVHLLVVDAHQGAAPLPAFSHKNEIRLAAHLEDGDRLSEVGAHRLRAFIDDALRVAEDKGVEEVVAFATSAIREAVNGEEVLGDIRDHSGIDIPVLSGEDEARLTFLAARRWFGWSSGRLLVLDIGGGSLEIASGADEEPDAAVSLPLGAGRLTRDWLTADPPSPEEVRRLRKHVRTTIAREVGGVMRYGAPDHAVATSKTFRQLSRIAGAAPANQGPLVRRALSHKQVTEWAERLPSMTAAERAELPGVSPGRAPQLPAGAIVADAAMDLLDVAEAAVCPWALREGVILRRLDQLRRDRA
ncbi:Ppx/GppA family phosphatase [Actinoallomurus sp. NBC_01490]|uniref:Ppx/GppA phosphatase family protein n=1 Tax=Actinoallomurus sp. NBC_01490 TaxID=2903557 RepID=UPI002E3488CE|nr:Ppx/GppA phosphatase family protein [Actinoallomurus sp. NBC_01490]